MEVMFTAWLTSSTRMTGFILKWRTLVCIDVASRPFITAFSPATGINWARRGCP